MDDEVDQYTKVVLSVTGVDLADPDVAEALGAVEDVQWSARGPVVQAVLYADTAHAAAEAVRAAQQIRAISGAAVPRVDEELVSVADVAARLGVTTETVRLWSVGKRRPGQPFPPPRAALGAGRTQMNVWAWGDVVEWLRAIRIDPEPGTLFLTAREVAQLNVQLANQEREIDRHADLTWLPIGSVQGRVMQAAVDDVAQLSRVLFSTVR